MSRKAEVKVERMSKWLAVGGLREVEEQSGSPLSGSHLVLEEWKYWKDVLAAKITSGVLGKSIQ